MKAKAVFGCLFVVLASILYAAFSSIKRLTDAQALTPEQREAEDKQKAEEARIAAAHKAEADKRAEEAKLATAHQAEQDRIAAEQKAIADKSKADALVNQHRERRGGRSR